MSARASCSRKLTKRSKMTPTVSPGCSETQHAASPCDNPPQQWPLEAKPRSSLVVLQAAGEPSSFAYKLKGDQRPLPIRNGWATTCTIKGHCVMCTVAATTGQPSVMFLMEICHGTNLKPARSCCTCGQAVAAGAIHTCSTTPISAAVLGEWKKWVITTDAMLIDGALVRHILKGTGICKQ